MVGGLMATVSSERIPVLRGRMDSPKAVITTALLEAAVTAHFPEFQQVAYVGSTEEALTKGTPVLIDWDEWRDGYHLVIPVYPDGRKVAKFRTPVVYERTRGN